MLPWIPYWGTEVASTYQRTSEQNTNGAKTAAPSARLALRGPFNLSSNSISKNLMARPSIRCNHAGNLQERLYSLAGRMSPTSSSVPRAAPGDRAGFGVLESCLHCQLWAWGMVSLPRCEFCIFCESHGLMTISRSHWVQLKSPRLTSVLQRKWGERDLLVRVCPSAWTSTLAQQNVRKSM